MDLLSYPITDVNQIPESSLVEEFYDNVLEAQLIPSNVRITLKNTTTIEKKWATIVAYKSMIHHEKGGGTEISSSYGSKDKQLLKILKNVRKRPDIPALLGIKSRLNTGNKSWMEGFIADKGIPVLLTAMESRLSQVPMGELDAAVLFELISCLNPIMNNGLTMKIFLSTKRALRIITQCLIFQWKALAISVLEILSVICDYSTDAAYYVIKYFRNVSKSRREPPFKYLVDALLTEDVEIKTGILLLINQIIASIEDLDKRMILRSELKVVQFGLVCDQTYNELVHDLQAMKSSSSSTPPIPTHRNTTHQYTTTLMANGRNTLHGIGMKKRKTLTNEQNDDNHIAKTYATALGIEMLDDDDLDDDFTTQEYADDGKTPICPFEGIMAGVCISGKNRGKMSKSILKEFGNKSTKDRWYILSGDRLTWWGTDCREISAEKAHLDVSEILHIRPYSTNPELISPDIYPFEVETKERVYSFGCLSEIDKENWVTALYIARDKSVLKKYSYNFNQQNHSSDSATNSIQQFENFINLYKKQIIVYEVLTTEDYEQCILTSLNINLTDPMDIIKYLQYETLITGLNEKFLKILYEFIIIPSDTKFGELFWDQILKVCRDLRSLLQQQDSNGIFLTSSSLSSSSSLNVVKDYSLTSYEIDLESCLRILKKKDHTPIGLKVNEMNKLTLELFTKKEEIERLQQEIKALRGNPQQQSHLPPLTSRGDEQGHPIATSNRKADDNFFRSDSLIDFDDNPMNEMNRSNPLSSKNPMNPISVSIEEPSEEKFERTKNRINSLRVSHPHKSVALPREKKQLPPHVGTVAPQNLPVAVRDSQRSIPPPPLLPGMRASIRKKARVPSAAVARLPLSVGPAPTKKMRTIFWNKMNEEKGIWQEVSKIHVNQLHINFEKLQDKFSVAEDSSSQPGSGGGGNGVKLSSNSSPVQKKKNQKVSLIDPKRSHLIEISLNRIRKQPEEIVTMITELDPEILTLDLTEIFLTIIPTSKEFELVKSYQGDVNQLGRVEQVILAISTIPRLEKRLLCHRLVFTWPHAIDKLIGHLNILENGCQELLNSQNQSYFISLFSYILSIGNYLNHGTHRIAGAVQLESLLKLSTIKSNQASTSAIRSHKETLLHYILQEMMDSDGDPVVQATRSDVKISNPIEFLKQFKYLFLLSDLNYQQLHGEYKQYLEEYHRVQTEYELLARGLSLSSSAGAGGGERLISATGDLNHFLSHRLEQFLFSSRERIVFLDKYFLTLNQKLMQTFEFFGERFTPPALPSSTSASAMAAAIASNSNDPCQKFFHTLIEFLNLLQRCCDDLEKWIEEESKILAQQKLLAEQQQQQQQQQQEEYETEDEGDIFDTEPEENLTTKENLFSRFRDQQTGTADDLISQLKRKMYRRQSTTTGKGLKSLNSMTIEEREQYISTGTVEPSTSNSTFVFPGLRKVPQGERKMS